MIRVLQVIGMMERAGAETFLMNVYRAIDRKAVQFDFLVHETHPCAYDEEIEDLGGCIYRLPRPSAANLLTGYRAGCKRLFAEHPEHAVVHGHLGSSAAVYLHEAHSAGKYAIAHSHCVNYYPGLKGVEFALSTAPVRYAADYFMACSREAGIDRFGKRIVSGNHFEVISNGIPVAEYACTDEEHDLAKERLGLSGRTVFGTVGRLSEEKNQAFALDVFAHYHATHPHAVFLIAGDGPLRDALSRQARLLGIERSVAFLGSTDIVPHIMKALDVFLFPSLIEGLGMAAIEAQAAGALSYCSEHIPAPAIICDTCRQLPLSQGARTWAHAIEADLSHFAASSAQRTPRASAAQRVAQAGFDIADTAAHLQHFYLNAAESRCRHTQCGALPIR